MKVYVDLKFENTIEMEVPDGMTEEDIYDYVSANLKDEVELTVNGGAFSFEVWES